MATTCSAGAPTPYAFRGLVRLPERDDYSRFTADFEASWRGRFALPSPAGCGG